MEKNITIPVDMAEKLLDLAGRDEGLNDTPTLMLFAEMRLRIEQAKKR
jgi:hypothetical protein